MIAAGGTMASTLVLEGIEAIMFRAIGDGPSRWELLLPPEVLRLPEDLARVDALLDGPVLFAPFAISRVIGWTARITKNLGTTR